MKTDKNNLFRAIGDIDDRYVAEILQEDAAGSVTAVNTVKKKSGAIRYLKYYIPAAAGLLIAIVCIRSAMRVRQYENGTSSAAYTTASDDAAAPSENVYEEAEALDSYSADNADHGNIFDIINISPAATEASSEASSGGASEQDAQAETSATLGESSVQIANPFIECNSLRRAAKIAGFDFDIPDELMDKYDVHISAIEDSLIQVIFYSGGEEVFRLRKGYVADISGDYAKYSIETELNTDSFTGTFFGNDEDNVNTAVWTSGEFTYSLTTAGNPMESSMVEEIIETVTGD